MSPLTGALLTAAPLSTTSGLSATNANNVVEVIIKLLVGPTSANINKTNLTSADDPVTDSISLRLTTPPDNVASGSAASGFGPCQ